jgi:hypothetical protein
MPVIIDHHNPGDPGYGRSPAEFLPASSIGQVIAILGDDRIAINRHTLSAESPQDLYLVPAGALADDSDPAWCLGTGFVPTDIVLTAAADHCLDAARRGECPGVDPDDLTSRP